jgi:hypothetical protein
MSWADERTGLPCLIRRNSMGGWCGYVGVPKDHPASGGGYDDVDVDVHGGLTYAGTIDTAKDHPEFATELWWLGFDCGHAYDLMPGMMRFQRQFLPDNEDVYRDLDYVRTETTRLASQLSVLGEPT